jgi:NitT/TauT family transport system substrate-binding protein
MVSIGRKVLLGVLAWAAAVTGLHAWLNVDWSALLNDRLPEAQRKLHVAYIPVT